MEAVQPLKLSLRFGTVAGLQWGPADGTPLLALHGWLDNAATFEGLLPYLGGFRAVAPDLPGHGHSDHRPPGATYHLLDGVADVVEIMDALGWERAVVVGHSMGGGIGTLLAGALPQRVEKLVLIESLGPIVDTADFAAERLETHLRDRSMLGGKRLPVYPDVETAARARKAAGDLSLNSALTLARRGTRPVEGGVTWRSDPRLKVSSPHRLTEEQVQAFLKRIGCPTLVVMGADGLPAALPNAGARLPCLSQGTQITVPGGHHVHLDQPDSVGPAIAKFLTP